jgi:hypothetical protein
MMAAKARFWISTPKPPTFNMQSLWQLAVWGSSAGLALGLAVAASYSETGARRLMLAMNSSSGEAPVPGSSGIPATPVGNPSIDTAPLAETVRVLAAERDRLAARMERIERQLDGLTGSINAQTGSGAFSSGATHVSPPATGEPVVSPAPAQPASSNPTRLPDGPLGGRSEAAAGAAAPGNDHSSSADASKVEFGVDIGGASNFEGLRRVWTSTKGSNSGLFDGLHPVVALRENGRTKAAELRLIVGPFADAEAATRLCATLAAAHRYCRPAGFGGQRLADADKAIERRPAAPPRPAPKAVPRPFGLLP